MPLAQALGQAHNDHRRSLEKTHLFFKVTLSKAGEAPTSSDVQNLIMSTKKKESFGAIA